MQRRSSKKYVELGAKACAGLVLAVLAAGAVAPFLHADRYRERVQSAMSAALGREVFIDGSVALNLFSGPGISVSDVRIADEPGAGSEPFAYVDEVIAVPRLWSLWTGHVEFSSLTLQGAHLNLARVDRGPLPAWNFAALARPNMLAEFPVIRMRDSRINFKVNGQKTSFYLMNVDLDIAPQSRDGARWDLRLAGQPARTDRPARGFGAIEARGRWIRNGGSAGHMEVDARLMRSEIGDIVSLVYGHDAGVHGIVAGAIHVAGEPSALGVEGEVRVSELHGWDQSPPSGGAFPFRVSGTADLAGQHYELFAEPKSAAAPLSLHFAANRSATGDRQRMNCAFDLRSEGLPISGIPGLLRNFGAQLPEGFHIDGLIDGNLHMGSGAGWTGDAMLRQIALRSAQAPALNLAAASITVGNGEATLAPSQMESDGVATAALAGHYSFADGSYGVELTSNGGSLATMLRALPGITVPVLSTAGSGRWDGQIAYLQPAAGTPQWTAAGTLTAAEIRIPQLAAPVLVSTARVQMTGPALQIDKLAFTAGAVAGTGDYRYIPEAVRPHQFHIALADSSLAAIAALLKPSLARQHSLLDRALNLGRESMPAWMQTMGADGYLQARTLSVKDTELHRVRAHVEWDGSTITLPDFSATGDPFTIASKMTIRLTGAAPRYAATARVEKLPWQGGTVSGIANIQASGADEASLLSSLRLSGTFDAQQPTVAPLGELSGATGQFEADWRGQHVAVRFPQLRIVNADGDVWTGEGAPGPEPGEVILQLTTHDRRMILAGSLTDERQNWVER